MQVPNIAPSRQTGPFYHDNGLRWAAMFGEAIPLSGDVLNFRF